MNNKERVLAYARQHKQVTVNDVCRDLGITRGSAGQVLTSMANRGELKVITLATNRVKGESATAYRVRGGDKDAELMRLVLFGSAGRKA